MTIIDRFSRTSVLKIKRIDDQRRRELHSITHPQTRTIKIHQQPLVRIRIEGIGVLDAGHEWSHFRTDEGVTSISAVHVQPDVGIQLAYRSDLYKIVKGAGAGSAQSGRHVKRHQAVRHVLSDGRLEPFTAQRGFVVRFEYSQLHQANHRCFLNARMRLRRAIGHQFRQERWILRVGFLLLQHLNCLWARRQHRHQDTFGGRTLNYAAAALLLRQKLSWQVDCFSVPIQHDSFKFSTGWTSRPRETDAADRVWQQITEDRGERVAGREVGVESWMLPVSDL